MKGAARIRRARTYAALGGSFVGRSGLFLLGFLAPASFGNTRLNWVGGFLRTLWVKPKRIAGLKLGTAPTDWSETMVFEEIFLNNGYDLELVTFQPTHVIDCGGHIGMFSLLAEARYRDANIMVFEPNPNNFSKIDRQRQVNALSWKCIPGAVSDRDGEAELSIVNSHGSSIRDELAGASQTVRVRTYDLAAEIRRMTPQKLLLKLDIEGEERNIWDPLLNSLPETTAVFFETHHGAEGWDLATRGFQQHGFEVRKLNQRGIYFDGFANRVGSGGSRGK